MTRYNGIVTFRSFNEWLELLTDHDITRLEVLSIIDNNEVEWTDANSLIIREDKELYKVSLSDGTYFTCDDTQALIDYDTLDPIFLVDAYNSNNILGLEGKSKYSLKPVKLDVISIDKLGKKEDTYGFSSNGGIIVSDKFILAGTYSIGKTALDRLNGLIELDHETDSVDLKKELYK